MNRRILSIVLLAGCAAIVLFQVVLASPPLPSRFYGTVRLNGSYVPDGTLVSAWCGSLTVGVDSTETFGIPPKSVYSLNAIGDDPDTLEKDGCETGETVQFKIDGNLADQSALWSSGSSSTLDLTATVQGILVVEKLVYWNDIEPFPAQLFTICVLDPISVPSCKSTGYTGGNLTWTGLSPGQYTVTEIDPGSQWSIVIAGSPVTVVYGAEASATVINSRKLGSLQAVKIVNWNGVTPDGQEFHLCITGPSYPSIADCQNTAFTGGTVTWSNLLPGLYNLTETNPGSQWTVQVNGSPAVVPVDGGQASASVTNTRKLGSLQVTKTVNWNGLTPDPGKVFQICIQGPSYPITPGCQQAEFDGQVLVWSNLIPGNYVVTETNPGSEWNMVAPSSPLGVPDNGGQASTEVTNTRKRGSLTVTKMVDWNGITPNPAQTFQICIQGPSHPIPNCQLADFDGTTLPWNNLVPGSYTITETDPGTDWAISINGSPAQVPDNGGNVASTVINTRKLSSLDVVKTVNWSGVTPIPSKTFQICVTGPSFPAGNCKSADFDGVTLTWNNLIPGSYAVTETSPGTEWIVLVTGSPVNVPSGGGGVTAGVVNTRKLGSVQVVKTVYWSGIPPDPVKQFQVCLTGPSFPNTPNCKDADFDGAALTWTSLIPGDYVVTETNPGSDWVVAIQGSPVTVPGDGSQASAQVANTRKLRTLDVTKVINWKGVTPVPGQVFQICITGPSHPSGNCQNFTFNNQTFVWTDLLPGTYHVNEIDPGTVWNVAYSNNEVIVPDNGGVSVMVTNTRKLGSLNLTKVVNWRGVTPFTGQTFQVCLTGPSFPVLPDCKTIDFDGGDLLWSSLIPGGYSVTEINPGPEWSVDLPPGPVNVTEDGGQTSASVTNSRKLGTLVVNKTVNWNGVAENPTQTFQICIQGLSYPTGNCQFADSNGATLTWNALIPGNYTVMEVNPGNNWIVSSPVAPIPVPTDGGQVVISVINTHKLGSLQITKTVNWNGISPDKGQIFQICLIGPSFPVTAGCKSMDYNGGALTWANLIPGNYGVSETDPGSAWSTTITGSPVVVPNDGGQVYASVINTRKLGSLNVTKVVDWKSIKPDLTTIFRLCLSGPSYPQPNCVDVGYGGAVLKWHNLIPGSYQLTEVDPGNAWKVEFLLIPISIPVDGSQVNAVIKNITTLEKDKVLFIPLLFR